MAKNSQYFPHDYNARNDPKLVKLSMKGWEYIGIYWAITEMLHEQGGWLNSDCEVIAFALRTDKERIATLLEEPGLFIKEGNRFSCQRVLDNLKKREDISAKAHNSATKRWSNAKAMPTHSEGNAKKGKERKGNNTYIQEIFDYFCLKTKKQLKLNEARKAIIEQRLQAGFTPEQLKQAIDNFSQDDWPDRHKFTDIVYCMGIRNKIDNLEKWLNYKPILKSIKPY